jgi:hypothetical protein
MIAEGKIGRTGSELRPFSTASAVIITLSGEACDPNDWLIKPLIKMRAKVSHRARWRYVQVASAFPLAHHYRAVLVWGP